MLFLSALIVKTRSSFVHFKMAFSLALTLVCGLEQPALSGGGAVPNFLVPHIPSPVQHLLPVLIPILTPIWGIPGIHEPNLVLPPAHIPIYQPGGPFGGAAPQII